MKSQLFCLLSLFSITFAVLSGSTTTNANGNFASTLSLAPDASANVLDTALNTALNGGAGGITVSVVTSAAATVTFNVSLNAALGATISSQTVVGGKPAPVLPLASGLTTTGTNFGSALLVGFSATPAGVTTTLTITLPAALVTLSTGQTSQFNLFVQSNDFSASGSAATSFYGAVAVSVNQQTYTYTIPANVPPQMFLAAVNLNGAQALNTAAATTYNAGTNTAANVGGSVYIDLTGAFVPIAFATNYTLTNGVQYAFGKNIQVAPFGTSAAGSNQLQVNYNGNFGTNGASNPPATTNGGYFNGYYQFTSNSNLNNVIQWTSDTSNTAKLYTASASGTTYTNAEVAANSAFTNSVSWYKATTAVGSSTAASAWAAYPSSRSNVVTGTGARVSVWANVNSYSQWAIAASTPNATGTTTTGAASAVQFTFATVAAALVFAFAL